MVELAVALACAMVLATIAVPPLTRARERKAAMNARDSFVWAAAVGRALAIERGATVAVELNANPGIAVVRLGADTIQKLDIAGTYGAGVQVKNGTVTVCYTPRGYANPGGCSKNLPATIQFVRGPYHASVTVGALGQVNVQ